MTISDADCIAPLRNAEQFAGLTTLVKVVADRDINGVVSTQSRYYISSLKADALTLLDATKLIGGLRTVFTGC